MLAFKLTENTGQFEIPVITYEAGDHEAVLDF